MEFISEEPIPGWMSIEHMAHEATQGDYSMRIINDVESNLNGKEAADALSVQGSDPSFFRLTEKGEDDIK